MPQIEDLNEFMSLRGGETRPLAAFNVDEKYIVGIYQGSLSRFDILIKYRQKINNSWSRIRTPKHIHWAVDILIKLHEDENKTKEFIESLIEIWNNDQLQLLLNTENLLQEEEELIEIYESLNDKGEYSIKFLILLAKLLMVQEKTNLETAYMFKSLLDTLHENIHIFSIISIATHNRR